LTGCGVLKLEHDISSQDTFGRLFGLIARIQAMALPIGPGPAHFFGFTYPVFAAGSCVNGRIVMPAKVRIQKFDGRTWVPALEETTES
jgi:hypothetical protein